MLRIDTVRAGAAFALADVRCSHARGGWSEPELAGRHSLVLVRRGVFRRQAEGRAEVIEPNFAYFQRAGAEQRIAHPAAGGDRCLSITLSPEIVGALARGQLPESAFPTTQLLDWRSRRLVALARAGVPADELEEELIAVVSCALAVARGDTRRALPSRTRIVAQAREALAADPALGLRALAGRLGCSPDHLSRAFPQVLGLGFTRYRRRLRVRLALDRLADGEAQLAWVAASVGFADHAHLTRSTRAELGITPAAARAQLAAGGSRRRPGERG
jgi:AraC-like DNA-binding protein